MGEGMGKGVPMVVCIECEMVDNVEESRGGEGRYGSSRDG